MKKLAVVLCLAAVAASAHATTFDTLLPQRSSVGFKVTEMGVPVNGGFSRFSAKLRFDPAHPEAASLVVDIDIASINAGSSEANDMAVSPSWFDSKRFATARFVSKSVKALGGGRYQAVGDLVIKGRSLSMAVPFTFVEQAGVGHFDGRLPIKRTDFAIGAGEWADPSLVANEVEIVFHIEAAARTAARP